MSDYLQKYQHIERWGTDEVEGIEQGTCLVFPKIDGTNGSIWMENGVLRCGSRNRILSLENDNQGFMNYIWNNKKKYEEFFEVFPGSILYCEWLTKHTLNTYLDDAWKKAYVFDVRKEDGAYVDHESYSIICKTAGIDCIPLLEKIENPTYEQLIEVLNKNTYLVKEGIGEGIVIKNYSFRNKYGRITWAKIITSEFKEEKREVWGEQKVKEMVELEIVEKFLTPAFVEKEYSKLSEEGWSSKKIPQLLGTVYHEFVTEEIWNILKEFKNPTINFKTLNFCVINKIKEIKKELF